EGPREGVRRQVFVPNWGKISATFYVRSNIPSAATFALARNEIKQVDSAIPIYEMKTVEGQLDETLLTDRLIALLSAGFGLVATLLASVGLYGVMAFVVAQRKKELGIRLALGAQPGVVIWMVMREVMLLLIVGLAIGIPAGLGLGRYVASQLYGIQAHDALTATSAIVLLALVSAAAGLIPAERASRIDPMLALRQEERSAFQDLSDPVWKQLRSQLPAASARVAVVVVDRHLRHRHGLRSERAGSDLGLDIGQRRAARRTRRIGRTVCGFEHGRHLHSRSCRRSLKNDCI